MKQWQLKQKKPKDGFLGMFLGTLLASLLANMLAGIVVKAKMPGRGEVKAGKVTIRQVRIFNAASLFH